MWALLSRVFLEDYQSFCHRIATEGSKKIQLPKTLAFFDIFKTQFADLGKNIFGSCWICFVKTANKNK